MFRFVLLVLCVVGLIESKALTNLIEGLEEELEEQLGVAKKEDKENKEFKQVIAKTLTARLFLQLKSL